MKSTDEAMTVVVYRAWTEVLAALRALGLERKISDFEDARAKATGYVWGWQDAGGARPVQEVSTDDAIVFGMLYGIARALFDTPYLAVNLHPIRHLLVWDVSMFRPLAEYHRSWLAGIPMGMPA